MCLGGVLVSQGEFLMPLQFPWMQVVCFQGGPKCSSVVTEVVLASPGHSRCPSCVSQWVLVYHNVSLVGVINVTVVSLEGS